MIFTNYFHQGTQQEEKYWMCNIYQNRISYRKTPNIALPTQSLIFPSSFTQTGTENIEVLISVQFL